jgi:hypothetical protein
VSPVAVQILSGDDDMDSTGPVGMGLKTVRNLGVREVFSTVEGEVSPGVVGCRC